MEKEKKEYRYYFSVAKEQMVDVNATGMISKIPQFPRRDEVFVIEIDADEMVEMMQHLWHIANKRRGGN